MALTRSPVFTSCKCFARYSRTVSAHNGMARGHPKSDHTRGRLRAPVGTGLLRRRKHAMSTLLKQRSKKFGRQKSRFKKKGQRRKLSAPVEEPLSGNSRSGDPPKIRGCAQKSSWLDLFTLAFTLAPLASREASVVSIFCRHTWPLFHSIRRERLACPSRERCSALACLWLR
ncbi:hypothetical protein MRX96_001360 [Rhipicephalus microplus]